MYIKNYDRIEKILQNYTRKARISDNILKKIEVAINTGIFYAWTISSV